MKKRIVIIDDHAGLREMLSLMLSRDPAYEVTAQTDSGHAALELCRRTRPDLVILDLMLPELNGMEVLRRLRAGIPSIRVLIYSGTSNHSLIVETLKAQPNGFVDKNADYKTLLEAIRAVLAGSSYFSSFTSGLLFTLATEHEQSVSLSVREREVLQLIAEGLSNKEIAWRLDIAVRTAEHHRENLMRKLQLHDVAGLVRYAVREGIVSIE